MTNHELILALSACRGDSYSALVIIKQYDNPVIWEAVRRTIGSSNALDAADILMMVMEPASLLHKYARNFR